MYDSNPSYYTDSELGLRENMSLSSAILTIIPKGKEVKVINSFYGDWWKVYYNGKTGHVKSRFLSYGKENYYTTSNSSSIFGYSISNIYDSEPSYYAISSLNLRENMSSNSAIITRIPKGREVKVIESFFGKWWKVYYNGRTGHVASRYLSKNKISTTSKSYNYKSYSPRQDSGNYRLTDRTSFRTRPNSQSPVILRFMIGDTVEVIDSADEWWWQVRFNGKIGWVKKRLLTRN